MKKLDQKGFAPLDILVIVLAILAAGFFVYKTRVVVAPTQFPTISATPDETAGWKTYTDVKYGYSLKYPYNWFKKDITNDPSDNEPFSGEIVMFDSSNIENNREAMHLPSSGLNIVTQKANPGIPTCRDAVAEDYLTIDGSQVLRCKIDTGEISYSILVFKMGLSYSFSYPAETKDTAVIDQILSTFKFTQ